MSEEAVVKIVLKEEGKGGSADVSLSSSIPNPPIQQTAPLTSLSDSVQDQLPPKYKAIHDIFMQSLDDLDAAAKALRELGFAAADIAAVREHIAQKGLANETSEAKAKANTELVSPQSDIDNARKQQDAIVAREKRERELLELEAKAALEVARKQQAAAESARKAEIAREERERQLLELEARAALEVIRNRQSSAAEGLEAKFDPTAEARRRHEREQQRKAVDAEYERMFGEAQQAKSWLDSALEISGSMRGLLGGIAGPLLGGVLDVAVAIRDAQEAAANISSDGKGNPSTTDALSAVNKASGGKSAGGKAAGGGGLIAAAGPAIAAVGVIKEVVDEISAAIIGAIKSGIGVVGGAAQAFADPNADPSVPLNKLGNAATQAGEKIAGVVPLVGYLGVVVGETTSALSGLMRAIDKTSERYAEFSPEITQSRAIAEIRQTMGDMRRAQEVSREMTQYLKAQSDLQQKFEDIKVKALVKILPAVTKILEVIEAVSPTAETIAQEVDALVMPIRLLAEAAAKFMRMRIKEDDVPIRTPAELLNDVRFETEGAGTNRDPGWVPRL